ncbi:hypothetical protein, conserved [Babesia bigemina]|uniref:Uncharacterized protein n=1 Tax=Babesia bigemina TaxID=5866 RepID=A0A061DBW3_BABBI|nr:hypothetical protein, conserved [Babesia bigemina]CDR98068.1 hypothetical protein, conserved [Babesia bigemina]|eukprot:XP_012770254.1 hypothetical protein, conserved [Babesia bigemina]
MLRTYVHPVSKGATFRQKCRFSSIFDVVRQRKLEQSNTVAADNPAPLQKSAVVDDKSRTGRGDESNAHQIWKQFNVLLSKPIGYRNVWQLRYLSARALELLAITRAEELCKITTVLAHMKYRNVVLLQGISEALSWYCKLRNCKISYVTSFLRACATLKFVPSYRHLDVFFAELDKPHQTPSVGDHLRFMQFMVENGLHDGDVFMNFFERCRDKCLNDMGYMDHKHLASFSQTQLIIDPTDSDVFNRICLNFERNCEKGEVAQFLMLSNSMGRCHISELPSHYLRVVGHYLEHPDKWSPKLLITVLHVLKKFYYRDTVALSRIGNITVRNISQFTSEQLCAVLNCYAAMSYKHKELVHGIVRSQFAYEGDKQKTHFSTGLQDVNARLKVLAGIANMLAKVDYKPIAIMKSITESTIHCMQSIIGDTEPATTDKGDGTDEVNLLPNTIPWVIYGSRSLHSGDAAKQIGAGSAPEVLTGSMIVDMLPTTVLNAKGTEEEHNKKRTALRRLLRPENIAYTSTGTSMADLSQLKVLPMSVDVVRQQSLKECMDEFLNLHFDGRHPASRRLNMRKLMQLQSEQLKLRKSFKSSNVLHTVRLEKKRAAKISVSIRKLKRKMRYAGSRHVQMTQYFINECRVLKRCFLRPYTAPIRTEASRSHVAISSGSSSTLPMASDDPRAQQIADAWKRFNRWSVSRPSIAQQYNEDFGNVQISNGHLNCRMDTTDATSQPVGYMAPTAGASDRPPVIPKSQWNVVRHLESFVDRRTPVFVDDALFMKPVRVSSLYSWRLKKKLKALERSHTENAMGDTIRYMYHNGLWRKPQKEMDVTIPMEQPLWRHLFTIVSSLHKLNFTSFDMINKLTKVMQMATPVNVEQGDRNIVDNRPQELCGVLVATLKGFGYMISSISGIISRDASGELASRLLKTVCNSNIINTVTTLSEQRNARIPLADLTRIMRTFNALVFVKYGRIRVHNIVAKLGRLRNSDDAKTTGSVELSVESGSAICFNRPSWAVMDTYESLVTLARICVSEHGGRFSNCGDTANEGADALIRLLDEVTYIQSMWSMYSSVIPGGETMRKIATVGSDLADALLGCLDKGATRDDVLRGVCAIRRLRLTRDLFVDGETACEDVASNGGDREDSSDHQIRLRKLTVEHRITADEINGAMCAVYAGAFHPPLKLRHDNHLRSGMVAIHTYADPTTAATGILHNYYADHYNAV